jgi:hypothetical protein
MQIPMVTSDWDRTLAKDGPLVAKNRYIEENPALSAEQKAFVARPGLDLFTLVGGGPIKGLYSSPGTFEDCLFVASGTGLYRVYPNGAVIQIFGGLDPNGTYVSMCVVAQIGATPERLFFCDGVRLYVYSLNSSATAVIGGVPANNDVIRIGSVYYKFTTGSVNAGTPLGTSAFPWLLALQLTPAGNFDVLYDAIMTTGSPGSTYSSGLTSPNPDAMATDLSGAGMTLLSKLIGSAGNAIVTSATGGTTISAFTGGGGEGVITIPMPQSTGATYISVLSSYVNIVPSQTGEMVGRMYYIEPGEIFVDELNYVTAESLPDKITDMAVFNNQLWLFGTSSIESWYYSGNADTPLIRAQGINFNKGGLLGSACIVENSMMFLSPEGEVLQISNGLEKIGSRSVEEAITTFIND